MTTRTMILFVAIFFLVFAAISWLDTGSIYWVGAIGGAIGAAIAFFLMRYLNDRQGTEPNNDSAS